MTNRQYFSYDWRRVDNACFSRKSGKDCLALHEAAHMLFTERFFPNSNPRYHYMESDGGMPFAEVERDETRHEDIRFLLQILMAGDLAVYMNLGGYEPQDFATYCYVAENAVRASDWKNVRHLLCGKTDDQTISLLQLMACHTAMYLEDNWRPLMKEWHIMRTFIDGFTYLPSLMRYLDDPKTAAKLMGGTYDPAETAALKARLVSPETCHDTCLLLGRMYNSGAFRDRCVAALHVEAQAQPDDLHH